MAGAMNDLLGGRLDFVFSSIPSLGGTVADGKVKLLGVAGKSRIKDYPQIAVDGGAWPAGGRRRPLVRPGRAARHRRRDDPHAQRRCSSRRPTHPELAERFKQLGVEIATGTPAQFKQALESDNARLGPFVRRADRASRS